MHKVAESVRFILEQHTKTIPADKRGSFIALCIARALSIDLPLPTSPVVSIQVFYGTTCYSRVADFVAALNEHYVLDTKLVLDYVFKHYKLRYALVFDPMAISAVLAGKSLTEELVPGNMLDIVNCNCTTETIDAFRMMLQEFKSCMNGEGAGDAVIATDNSPAPALVS
jgi:hypothetical protein